MTTIHTTTQPVETVTVPRFRTGAWRSANGRLWILQAALALGYVMTAVPKLSNDPHTLAQFADLGIGRRHAPHRQPRDRRSDRPARPAAVRARRTRIRRSHDWRRRHHGCE